MERWENEQNNSEMMIYTTEDGLTKIETTFDGDTVWLSIDQMAELFQRDKSTISRHIKNIFTEGELKREAVVANFATTAADGKTYQVTGIGKYCFYTCSSVTEIVLPNTITTIEDWAFAECSSLVKLTLPENVSNIGQNVFKKTSKLENIKCLATTPPSCTGDLLFKDGATIYVPSESVDTYKHAMYWEVYEIKNVDEFADGIYAPIMDADDDVKVYDLKGLRL